MNHYGYDELEVGHVESFSISVAEAMFDAFFSITGDCNPLHHDDGFAKQQMGGAYKGKVAYGMLTASFLSTLAGVYLPGENSLIHRIEAEFPAPVYVGDVLCFTGTIVRKNDTFRTIDIKVSVKNQDGQKVCRGKMYVGVVR